MRVSPYLRTTVVTTKDNDVEGRHDADTEKGNEAIGCLGELLDL